MATLIVLPQIIEKCSSPPKYSCYFDIALSDWQSFVSFDSISPNRTLEQPEWSHCPNLAHIYVYVSIHCTIPSLSNETLLDDYNKSKISLQEASGRNLVVHWLREIDMVYVGYIEHSIASNCYWGTVVQDGFAFLSLPARLKMFSNIKSHLNQRQRNG